MKWLEAQQYKYLETIVWWHGVLNRQDLMHQFGVSEPSATSIIKRYQQQCPTNLLYNTSGRYYFPSDTFSPNFTNRNFNEYLYLNSTNNNYMETLESLNRNISVELVRPLLKAIKQQLRLEITYSSIKNPQEERIIAPHSLVFDGLRWHTRAYCEKNKDYRDFVISRFSGDIEFYGKSDNTKLHDLSWSTILELKIQADPRFSEQQRKIIELDYQMVDGLRTIECRAALLIYTLRKFGLDQFKNRAQEQQIILTPESQQLVDQWLNH